MAAELAWIDRNRLGPAKDHTTGHHDQDSRQDNAAEWIYVHQRIHPDASLAGRSAIA